MDVLVAFGSKRGGTEGLAQMIGDALVAEGFTVHVQDAASVRSIADERAVIVVGALYAGRWHRDARRFVRSHAAALQSRPVWFVSSGPLDNSAAEREIGPVAGVARLMKAVGARGHVTFGGRLDANAQGFVASRMAKRLAGDWRDPEQVRAWVLMVAGQLKPRVE